MTDSAHVYKSKTKLLEASIDVIRSKGYAATRVEDICDEAMLTKGSFFHHFQSKDELALAAAEYWGARADAFFRSAPYRSLSDPLDRLLGYVDFRISILQGELPEFTCYAGTMIQEVYRTHPLITAACDKCISDNVAMVGADIAEAMQVYGVKGEWSAASLASFSQTVIQGAFILAKAKNDPQVARESLMHFRRYLEMLFAPSIPNSGGKS